MFKYLCLFLFLIMPSVANASSGDRLDVCSYYATKSEKKHEIKSHLLEAIAQVESGKWNETLQKKTPWPWTINYGGIGKSFESKQEAIKEVKRLRAKGVESIDVGCMQINLKYHPDAFASLDEAFDPLRNTDYAGKFVKNLYDVHKDWLKASMYYHSALPSKAEIYKSKIVSTFNDIYLKAKASIDKATLANAEKLEKHDEDVVATAEFANNWRKKKLAEYKAKKSLNNKHADL